jgi:putative membrane protein
MKWNGKMRMLTLAMAAPAFAACASTRQNDMAMAAGTVGSPMQIEFAPISPAESDMLRQMTDPNILGHVAMSDSVEVVMAQFAEQRTKNDDVLNFARQMDVDHSTDLQALRNLAQTSGIGMHTMVGELKASHMGKMVDSIGPQISEITFDRNYIISQVQMHQHVLAELQTLQGVTQNATLRDHINAMIPTVQEHLNKARDLAHKYDYISSKTLKSAPNP